MTADPRRILEHKLQGTVVEVIRLRMRRGVMCFSIPNELPKIEGRLRRFLRMGMKPGVGDLIILIDARAHFLELKVGDGEQTIEQRAFELECEFNGVPYKIARSFEEAIAIVEGWGALREMRRAA